MGQGIYRDPAQVTPLGRALHGRLLTREVHLQECLQRLGIAIDTAHLLAGELVLLTDLADEPVSSVDPALASGIVKLLIELSETYRKTLIMNIHSVDLALAHFPRVIGLRDGKISFDLPAAEVTDEHLAALYAGTPVPAGASHSFVFNNWLGCDSTVLVTVSELPTSFGTDTLSACPGTAIDYHGTMVMAGSR